MYNEELKKRFITTIESENRKREFENVFKITERLESEFGKDLYEMNEEEAQKVTDTISPLRTSGSYVRLQFVRKYVNWCKTNGIDGTSNAFYLVNKTSDEEMQTKTVKSPAHMQAYLDAVFDPESWHTTDNTYRCLLWLAYAGMREDDIMLVKTSDVDFRSMLIKYNGLDYPIYRQAITTLRDCAERKDFVYIHPNYTTLRDRLSGDLLLRGVRGYPDVFRFRTELAKLARRAIQSNKTKIRLSYYRAWLSGIFYRMYEREQIGLPVDFSNYAAEQMEGKTYSKSYGSRRPEMVYSKRIVRAYTQDYERWKKTLQL